MAEFVSFDPQAEVSGNSILAIQAALKSLGTNPEPFLKKYKLSGLKPDEWYSVQKCLDMLKEIRDKLGNFYGLISVGHKIPEFAIWPPDIDSVEKAFAALDIAYHLNHRNGEVGHYYTEFIGPRHIRVTAQNPWPSDFDYGLCYGLAQRFLPNVSTVRVDRAQSPCRLNGDDRCIYDITW